MGHFQIVEYLIKTAHANVTHADTDGWTALHNAAAKGYVPLSRFLFWLTSPGTLKSFNY